MNKKKWTSLKGWLFKQGYTVIYKAWRMYLKYFGRSTQGAQVVVKCADKYLLVKSIYRDTYSFPGGYRKRGESAKQNAIRELFEETGLFIEEERLELSFENSFKFGRSMCRDSIFYIELDFIELESIRCDDSEIESIKFFSLEELPSLMLDPIVANFFKLSKAPRETKKCYAN
ncbi:NUDIX hydrolase [Aliikangiella marina]|nr:NUDIX hydrolase [Aliikangiella marina]